MGAQPTLVDAFLALVLIGSVLSACHRGLGKEMLHTVMFAVMVTVGYIFFEGKNPPQSQEELAKVVTSCAFYLAAMYVFMWGAMKVIGPMILGREMIGYRSRFWAGALSIVKLVVVILGLNLWFAVHSPYTHPLRLQSFPEVVRQSVLVQFSDRKTDEVYRWLATEGYLDYNKLLEKPATEQQAESNTVQGLFGLAPSTTETQSGR